MKIIHTDIEGCFILEPKVIVDNRGYFFEGYNEHAFRELTGLDTKFVQDNQSYSTKGVLRGLHAQSGEHAQAKLVRVLQGRVIDVAVDARPDSDTFGQHVAVELSDKNQLQLFVPRGFLHGFVVLSDQVSFFYKCDNYYHKESEEGVIFNDEDLNIDWKLDPTELIVSEKDLILPTFKHLYK
ncbi:dTDP-4-dehydrorhamnose 3,5-epimerase [Sphingobacterium hungaricum]|uniref:dTDP-4-dehydrorhamnose 3,5-epimerase n=1 Tax=Sphingobacterium hungaricum TaxID=2082723 RepID=A0A928UY45_9SPHI|nr:dTDP-4-dehydrorhamnose 3,5-epimerase [Sphingobacterium hungaricum]MBE8714138.1 dTDP-4-dehydrorhamnose 3,5-epimerase [Sphingobacterium hungaricum]